MFYNLRDVCYRAIDNYNTFQTLPKAKIDTNHSKKQTKNVQKLRTTSKKKHKITLKQTQNVPKTV